MYFLFIPFSAWLNRFRGGGWGGQHVRGAPDFYVAPFYGLMAWLSGVSVSPWVHSALDWLLPSGWDYRLIPSAVLFIFAYLAWSTPAWGKLYRLDFIPGPDRPGEWYEQLFLEIGSGSMLVAFWLRMTIFLIPMGLCFGVQWILMGTALTACYIIGWNINRLNGIPWAEPIAGAAWGCAFVAEHYL